MTRRIRPSDVLAPVDSFERKEAAKLRRLAAGVTAAGALVHDEDRKQLAAAAEIIEQLADGWDRDAAQVRAIYRRDALKQAATNKRAAAGEAA